MDNSVRCRQENVGVATFPATSVDNDQHLSHSLRHGPVRHRVTHSLFTILLRQHKHTATDIVRPPSRRRRAEYLSGHRIFMLPAAGRPTVESAISRWKSAPQAAASRTRYCTDNVQRLWQRLRAIIWHPSDGLLARNAAGRLAGRRSVCIS